MELSRARVGPDTLQASREVAVPSSSSPASPRGACERWGGSAQALSSGQGRGRAGGCGESASSFQKESVTC